MSSSPRLTSVWAATNALPASTATSRLVRYHCAASVHRPGVVGHRAEVRAHLGLLRAQPVLARRSRGPRGAAARARARRAAGSTMSTSMSARTWVSCSPASPAAVHGAQRPLAGLARALLLHAHHGGEVVEPHPGAHGPPVRREPSIRPRARVTTRRVVVNAPVRRWAAAWRDSTSAVASGSDRVSRAARAVGLDRLAEHPGELAQVTHRLPEASPVGIRHARQPAADLEGRLEVVGGVGVGVRRPGQPAGPLGVVPGALGVTGPGEVQHEGGGVDVEVGAEPLEHLTGGAVHAGPHPVGQPLVGGVADQAVAEPQPVRAVGLEQAAEQAAGCARSRVRPSAARVRSSTSRRTLQARARRSSAGPGARPGTARRPARPWRPAPTRAARRATRRPSASRVTSSTNSGLPPAFATTAATSCGRSGVASVAAMTSRSTTSGGQRVEHDAGAGCRRETVAVAAPHHDARPRAVRRSPTASRPSRCTDAPSAQWASSTTTASGPGSAPVEQVDDDVGDPVGAVLRVDPVGLRGVGHPDLHDVGEQRRHRQQVGGALRSASRAAPRPSPRGCRGRCRAASRSGSRSTR